MRLASAAGDVARWPFERLAWLFERRLVWPLGERLAGRRPGPLAAGAAALVAIAALAVAAGVLWPNGAKNSRGRVAVAPAKVTTTDATAKPEAASSKGPRLQGAPPSFDASDGAGAAEPTQGPTAEPAPEPATAEAAESGAGEAAAAETSAASSSSAKPAPAGPAAMKVARRFSEAFVFYEIGKRPAEAKSVFGETATPELAEALGERPPRLPRGTTVPKARVVNLVPGPRAGRAYTVSVSLLRVGLTSELRLELRNDAGEWHVTDVRG